MSTTLPTVAVIGSGTMGAGIAEVAAAAGHPVLIYDIAPEAVVRAIDGIRQRLASRVSRGKLAAEKAGALLSRNLLVYGLGGLVAPFIGIKLIDMIVDLARLA